jgi:RimJ/RimL family protein N-acetyltransferase
MEPQLAGEDTELVADGLRLRPWRMDYAAALQEAAVASAASVGRWLPWCRADYTLDDARYWVDHCRRGWLAGEHFAFAIYDAADDALLGGVGINRIDAVHRTGNLGYWVRASQQRKGIAMRASRRVASFGFEQLSLQRIEIVVMPHNLASSNTALGLGAGFEGIARARLWAEGSSHDACVYGLVRSDLSLPQGTTESPTPQAR